MWRHFRSTTQEVHWRLTHCLTRHHGAWLCLLFIDSYQHSRISALQTQHGAVQWLAENNYCRAWAGVLASLSRYRSAAWMFPDYCLSDRKGANRWTAHIALEPRIPVFQNNIYIYFFSNIKKTTHPKSGVQWAVMQSMAGQLLISCHLLIETESRLKAKCVNVFQYDFYTYKWLLYWPQIHYQKCKIALHFFLSFQVFLFV